MSIEIIAKQALKENYFFRETGNNSKYTVAELWLLYTALSPMVHISICMASYLSSCETFPEKCRS